MRVPRIFSAEPLSEGETLRLDAGAARHVRQVLRLREGDQVVLFNGQGGEYEGRIAAMDRDGVEVALSAFHNRDVESALVVHLGQGVSRGERMDLTIQKAVELGVASIAPLDTKRCMVKLAGSRLDKRLAHWRGVAVAACEQSGRNRIPDLLPMVSLKAWLDEPKGGLCLLLDPLADQRLATLPRPEGPVTLLIGPEGGLSEDEREAARQSGFTGVTLGPRILRTETAALAALAAMQALWGDF